MTDSDARPPQPTTCFACGTENPVGLHVTFSRTEDGGAAATFVAGPHHEGWPGIVHGGILATLLDEAMAYALWFSQHRAVTARMDMRFRLPVGAGVPLSISSNITGLVRGVIDARARITLNDGSVVAEATGRFMPADVSY